VGRRNALIGRERLPHMRAVMLIMAVVFLGGIIDQGGVPPDHQAPAPPSARGANCRTKGLLRDSAIPTPVRLYTRSC